MTERSVSRHFCVCERRSGIFLSGRFDAQTNSRAKATTLFWRGTMDGPTVALIVGILSAAIASLGWMVSHHLTRKREIESRKAAQAQADRTRRLELRLGYHQ